MNNKYKFLIKNIGLLTVSSFATKLLSFFLVPIYTNILTTTEYGTYDLIYTTIGILIPILTLDIQSAIFRFTMEKDFDDYAIVSVSGIYFLLSSVFVIIALLLNRVFQLSSVLDQYAIFFVLMFITQNLLAISTAYVRGREYIRVLSISSVITSVVVILSNIIFLVGFRWGMNGYFIANIMGPLVQSIYLVYRTEMYKKIKIKGKYANEKKEMVSYSKPLIINSISWWINNVSDRYIVTFFLGLAENGVYSVASKIPSILNILQTIFNQAWTLSAVKDYDPEDKNDFFKNTYSLYNAIMVLGCSLIIVFDKLLARFLYAKDFYVAWRYVPWLTIAIVFGALSGYLGGFFAAAKNSKIFAQSTVIGAVLNILLNLILTPIIGALGAAIATTVSYIVVWAVRLYHSRKFIKFEINLIRDLETYILMIVQSIILLFVENNIVLYTSEVIVFAIIAILYRKDLLLVLRKFDKKGR